MISPTMISAAVGAAFSVLVAPLVLSISGFTSGGIAAGSLASSMMSSTAIANGGGVASGSLVAILQSWGAAGLTYVATAAVASVGGAVGGVAGWVTRLIIR
ncbi:hypothetical protein Q7C36_008274 [Tachysurus vachellii]|uniref:Interferon alpha-inducible protein 27-like protein 2A n=1 Tax=Tachysurus vachellii TaxID=175792 RepID=A0AA88NBT3_TACVA|nr:hypothetical protein Q7C36_008274 [Tachysurus vachellii]